MKSTDRERFWSKVAKSDGCWMWTACVGPKGYGQFWLDGRLAQSHRVSYEMTHGEIAAGLLVCHSCDVPGCVNPSHLFAGSAKENTADMMRKGRSGDARSRKLTAEDVAFIRSRRDISPRLLAEQFGVTRRNIAKLLSGQSWRGTSAFSRVLGSGL